MVQWRLTDLQRINIEVALRKWGRDVNEAEVKVKRDLLLENLHLTVEKEHPGVVVEVAEAQSLRDVSCACSRRDVDDHLYYGFAYLDLAM